jgi:hypothetical protein
VIIRGDTKQLPMINDVDKDVWLSGEQTHPICIESNADIVKREIDDHIPIDNA